MKLHHVVMTYTELIDRENQISKTETFSLPKEFSFFNTCCCDLSEDGIFEFESSKCTANQVLHNSRA